MKSKTIFIMFLAKINSLVIIVLVAAACTFTTSPNTSQSRTSSAPDYQLSDSASGAEAIDAGISGDFDGDGTPEKIFTRILNDADFNPGTVWSYSIEFSDPKFPIIVVHPMVRDGYEIVNEGYLDENPGELLSVVTCDVNKFAVMVTYHFDGKAWQQIADAVNVECMRPGGPDFNDIIIRTDSGVFVNQTDVETGTTNRREFLMAVDVGDYDGNGEKERLYFKELHDPSVHDCPPGDTRPWQYSVEFSDSKIPSLPVESAESYSFVFPEGDIDNKAGDELSVVSTLMMDKVLVTVYSMRNGKWKDIIGVTVSRSEVADLTQVIYRDEKGVWVGGKLTSIID